MYVKPWSSESEKILRQLSLSGRAYTREIKLPREFGMKCKSIVDNNFLDIATIRNKRQRKTIFVTPPDIAVIPKPGERGINFHFRKFKLL